MPEVEYTEPDRKDSRNPKVRSLSQSKKKPPILTFSTFTKCEYDPSDGLGVDVHVIDTGINIAHVNDIDIDGNRHGTHCAGTIASRKYGVAKHANVIAVKVLGVNGSGTMTDVIPGVHWAVQAAKLKDESVRAEFVATERTVHKGSVANMSLQGGKSQSLHVAVGAAVDSRLHFTISAGNVVPPSQSRSIRSTHGLHTQRRPNYPPTASQNAVALGTSTLGDERACLSNHGECTEVFALGLNILLTYIGSDGGTLTSS